MERLQEQLKAAEKLATLGRMIAGVAHDFNNVLTAILLYADLLAAAPATRNAYDQHVAEIRMAAQRGAALVHRILTYVRTPELQVCAIDEQLRTLRDMLSRLLGPDVKLVLGASAPRAQVQMDPAQFQQIVLNLAMNARDAMSGSGRLRLTTSKVHLNAAQGRRWRLPPGAYVVLKVADTGCGMDARTLAHVFEPFFTTKQKGNGLGMPAVRQAVAEAGGSIAVESRPGKGTNVTILLPPAHGGARRQDFLTQGLRSRIHTSTAHSPSTGAASTPTKAG